MGLEMSVWGGPRRYLDHLVAGLETGRGDLGDAQLFVVGLLGRDNGSVGDQGEMDARVGHQIGLELGQVNVEGALEAQRRRDGRHDLADQSVQVGVGGPFDGKVAAADVVDGLIVHHEGTVGVLEGGVGAKGRVVGLNHSSCDLSIAY